MKQRGGVEAGRRLGQKRQNTTTHVNTASLHFIKLKRVRAGERGLSLAIKHNLYQCQQLKHIFVERNARVLFIYNINLVSAQMRLDSCNISITGTVCNIILKYKLRSFIMLILLLVERGCKNSRSTTKFQFGNQIVSPNFMSTPQINAIELLIILLNSSSDQ